MKSGTKLQETGSVLVHRAFAIDWMTIVHPVSYRRSAKSKSSLASDFLRARIHRPELVPQSLLDEIAELRCRLGTTADLRTDPVYLLGFGNTSRRRPVIITLYTEQTLCCVVIFFELMLGPVHTGIYFVGDTVGDGDMLCHPTDRLRYLQHAIRSLFRFRHSAHTVRVCTGANDTPNVIEMGSLAVSRMNRPIKRRLELAPTFPQMLQSFGKFTRRHLHRKRILLEESGKVSFISSLSPQEAFRGMIALSHTSDFSRTFQQHRDRFTMLSTHPNAFCMGLLRDGEWLSILSGWRDGKSTFLDIQMNNHLYEKESLSAVMRSYMMEHEISRQQKDVVFVGGTSVLLQRYCTEDEACQDLLVRRRSLRCAGYTMLVKRFAPQILSQFLFSPQFDPNAPSIPWSGECTEERSEGHTANAFCISSQE